MKWCWLPAQLWPKEPHNSSKLQYLQQQQTAVPAAKKAKEEAQAEVINEPDTKIADGQGHRAMWGTVAEQSLTVLCDFVHQQSCDVRPCDKAS